MFKRMWQSIKNNTKKAAGFLAALVIGGVVVINVDVGPDGECIIYTTAMDSTGTFYYDTTIANDSMKYDWTKNDTAQVLKIDSLFKNNKDAARHLVKVAYFEWLNTDSLDGLQATKDSVQFQKDSTKAFVDSLDWFTRKMRYNSAKFQNDSIFIDYGYGNVKTFSSKDITDPKFANMFQKFAEESLFVSAKLNVITASPLKVEMVFSKTADRKVFYLTKDGMKHGVYND